MANQKLRDEKADLKIIARNAFYNIPLSFKVEWGVSLNEKQCND